VTTPEQKTVNAIGIKQAVMDTRQGIMADDIQEMKRDIKEIKDILIKSSDIYVSKKLVKYLFGLALAIGALGVQIYDHIIKK
jgi:hypothetical protein